MKLKSKLVLAASSLLVLSAAAVGTGTYAWFTATQAATVGVGNINVVSNVNQLKIAATPSDTTHITVDSANTVADTKLAYTAKYTTTEVVNSSSTSVEHDVLLTDVSGNGINFYKAALDKDHNLSSAVAIESASVPLVPNTYSFSVTFSKTDSTKNMAVFLSKTSSFTHGSGTGSLEGAFRAAVVDGTSVLAYYAPNDTITDDYTYISGITSSSVTKVNTLKYLDSTYSVDTTDATSYANGTYTSDQSGYLFTLTGSTSKTVKVVIWIEGQDSDAKNDYLSNKVNSSIVFNGVTEIKASA